MVCAEIPDEKGNPRLHELVSRWMVHGPCGQVGDRNSETCITVSDFVCTAVLKFMFFLVSKFKTLFAESKCGMQIWISEKVSRDY